MLCSPTARSRRGKLASCTAAAAAVMGTGSLAFTLSPGVTLSSTQGRSQIVLNGMKAASSPGASETSATAPRAAVAAVLGAASLAACSMSRSGQKRGARTAASVLLETKDFEGVCEQTGITMSRYLIELSRRGIIDEDLNSIMTSVAEASKVISKLVNTAPLKQAELLGLQGEINVQGEDQKKLDVITNDVFKNALRYTGKLGTLASEEEDEPVDGAAMVGTSTSNAIPVLSETFAETGKYVCVFDPLDGSSNVDAGIPVGTIFGVFEEPNLDECGLPEDLNDLSEEQAKCFAGTLQPGKALVAAGYVLYSASTELVLTTGNGVVVGFTLDASIGEFVMTRPHIKIPARGKIYSCNTANVNEWDEPMRQYITDIRSGKGESEKPYSLRYIGSMVGDIHRTLLYGGIFTYPADKKNQDGKLRLLYEGAPMSMIVEQAGGKAITGHSRVLDIPPVSVHQRVPVILGSPEDVEECEKYYKASDDPTLKERCERRLKGVVKA
eukprot:TRINITY_DN36808_c0_g1_i1.p1 TRINITY_DN36808_c0_g1~~TRINITY_DN36808_c0_g1_i1.p1  ORF type:complete len:498 (-),score=110.46 TRINITY_DN36808_c0_g1_i1:122-1615(-)